jgi:hypothetical protein
VSPLRSYDIARALDLVRSLREGLRKPEEIRVADLAADLLEAGVEAEEGEAEAKELRELADLASDLAFTVVSITQRKPSADEWLELRSLARDVLVEAEALGLVDECAVPPAQAGAAA